jgi:hypothetical protein
VIRNLLLVKNDRIKVRNIIIILLETFSPRSFIFHVYQSFAVELIVRTYLFLVEFIQLK